MYLDKVTGKQYGIDGGHDYIRHLGDIQDCQVVIIRSESADFTVIRDTFKWGTYGKDGNSPRVGKKLSELSNAHIEAIIETQTHISGTVREFFIKELEYRNTNNINIKD